MKGFKVFFSLLSDLLLLVSHFSFSVQNDLPGYFIENNNKMGKEIIPSKDVNPIV